MDDTNSIDQWNYNTMNEQPSRRMAFIKVGLLSLW